MVTRKGRERSARKEGEEREREIERVRVCEERSSLKIQDDSDSCLIRERLGLSQRLVARVKSLLRL